MKIFVPELKKKYRLRQDWKFWLYPFFTPKDGLGLHTNTVYFGSLKTQKMIHDLDVLSIKDYEKSSRDKSTLDYFLVTDKISGAQAEAMTKLIKNPMDLKNIGPDEDIYVVVSDFLNGPNKTYTVWCKHDRYSKNQFDNHSANGNVSNADGYRRLPYFTDDLDARTLPYRLKQEKTLSYNELVWKESVNLGARADIEIKGHIPISHVLKTGAVISFLKMDYKYGREKHKRKLTQLVIEGLGEYSNEIPVLTEDLNTMDIELL